MTVTIHIPPDQEEAIKREAERRGLSLEEFFLKLASDDSPQVDPSPDAQTVDPEEWRGRINRWLDSIQGSPVVLSDEAMSRDSIYDRI